MPAKSQLDSLLKHADWQEQQAKSQWLQARQTTQLAQAQLQELRRYLDEYQQQPLSGVCAVSSLQHRESFSKRLQLAITEQGKKCRLLQHGEDELAVVWQEAQAHSKALQDMQARRAAVARTESQRREQRQLDDLSHRRGAAHA